MTAIEVLLIVVGFICICISFFVSRKTEPENKQEDEMKTSEIWTEKEEKKILERVDEILTERQNDLLDTTEEQMNRLCNDKIMAVDEFSRQILEKIENNHQEVVFMYNLLTEKEKSVKDIVLEPVHAVEEPIPVPMPEPAPAEPEEKPVVKTDTVPKTAIERMEQKKPTKSVEAAPQKQREPQRKEPVETKRQPEEKQPMDANRRIQKMYQEGKSILEISKALNIGQGEVKLVIALYGGQRN